MSRRLRNRSSMLAAVIALAGCHGDGGATTSLGTTSSGTGTGGSPLPSCFDNYSGNHEPASAADLAGLFTDLASSGEVLVQGGITARACDAESDWYKLGTLCPGRMALQVRADEPNTELRLSVGRAGWFDTSDPTMFLATTPGDRIQIAHTGELDGLAPVIEVEHVSGPESDYALGWAFFPEGPCVSSAWICLADDTEIDAEEHSCEVLPSGSSCPSGDVYTQPVDLPKVFDGDSTWVEGFTIFADPHDVVRPHAPTSAELATLESRCIDACAAHFSMDEVTANCGSASFTDIVLRDVPSIPSRTLIPSGEEDGSELFTGQGAVACGDLYDCSAAFASQLHSFRQGRMQPGPESDEQGFHEQYLFNLWGSSVTFTGAASSTPLGGIARFSDADPQVSTPRPVYLADLSFSSQDETELDLDCSDESQATPTIDVFAFFLTQPAFGVREGTTDTIGFPPGALVYRIGFIVDSELTWIDGTNRINVYGEATPSGITLQLTEMIRVPCGAGTADITAVFSLTDSSTISDPPAITLDLPDWMLCPNWISIDGKADVTDPQNDVESVRWWANGHLLAPTVVRVFGGQTTFSVVACDSRGGCTRAEHTVQCIPV
jgi:hypothetical protein